MFTLAYFPPLWNRVMDPLLVRAVGSDPTRVNFQPAKREKLIKRYGLEPADAFPEGPRRKAHDSVET
jgi:alkane 1-monooxygenase